MQYKNESAHSRTSNATNGIKANAKSVITRMLLAGAVGVGILIATGCKTTNHKLPHESWKPPGMLMSIALLAMLLSLSGCADRILTIDPKTGVVTYHSKRFGNMEKFDSVIVQSGTNRIEIKGYTSDQVQFAERVVGTAVHEAISAAKTIK